MGKSRSADGEQNALWGFGLDGDGNEASHFHYSLAIMLPGVHSIVLGLAQSEALPSPSLGIPLIAELRSAPAPIILAVGWGNL